MNTFFKRLVWLVMLIPAVYLAIAWNSLPETIVMQYDFQGRPTRYGGKNELLGFTALLIVVSALVYLLLTNMYKIDPKKLAAENKDRLYRIAFAVVVFMAAIECMIIYTSITGGIRFSIGLVFSGVGLLFAFIGNYMPNMKPNYFAGLRLPWTLENEVNWKKTHLLAGKLWFAGGLVIAVICLFTSSTISLIVFSAVMMVLIIIPTVFSYRLYKRQKQDQLI